MATSVQSFALQENIYIYKKVFDDEDQGSLPPNICTAPISSDTMIANNGVSLGDVDMNLGTSLSCF